MKRTLAILCLVTLISAPAEASFTSKMKTLGHKVKVSAEYSVAAVIVAIYIYSRGNQ